MAIVKHAYGHRETFLKQVTFMYTTCFNCVIINKIAVLHGHKLYIRICTHIKTLCRISNYICLWFPFPPKTPIEGGHSKRVSTYPYSYNHHSTHSSTISFHLALFHFIFPCHRWSASHTKPFNRTIIHSPIHNSFTLHSLPYQNSRRILPKNYKFQFLSFYTALMTNTLFMSPNLSSVH